MKRNLTNSTLISCGLLALTTLFVPTDAWAEMLYRCQDAHGAVIWQQRPCSGGATVEARSLANRNVPKRGEVPASQPLADPKVEQALARIDREMAELEARQERLRAELDAALARPGKPPRREELQSERERLASERAALELTKERERRYRAELRLIEKRLDGLVRERQLLLRGR